MKLSVFRDRSGATIDPLEDTWEGVCARLASPPDVADKAQAVLFSLCEFGDKRTERGSLRSNDNVVRVYGACGDYDGEKIPPEVAVQKLAEVGVRSFVYTSPSHTDSAPRWRVVLPFDTAGDAEQHTAAIEKLNGIVGGGLSSESFTLSQPYYIGRVAGGVFKSWKIDGRDIRGLDIPRLPWRGAQSSNGSYRTDTATLVGELEAGQEVHPAIVALAMRGFTREELEDIVRRGAPGWERPERADVACDQDIPRAVESAARKREGDLARKLAAMPIPPKPEPTIATPKSDLFSRVSDMTAVYTPTQWLVRAHIEHPSLSVLFGDPEAGKSFIAIDWACCVALGRPWNGHKVKQRPVLYLAGEGFNGLSKRFLAWKIANNVSDAEWKTAQLFVSRRAVDLLNFEAGKAMWDTVTEMGITPGMIVIDTLSRMTPGMDESAAKEMSLFVRWCDETKSAFKCTILVIHHTGVGDKSRVRGSSVLKGATDVEIGAAREPDGRLKLFNTKMKEGKRFAEVLFTFNDIELPWIIQPEEPGEAPRHETSAVLGKSDAPAAVRNVPKGQDALMNILRRERTATVEKLRGEFKREFSGDKGNSGRAFNRAMDGMLKAGLAIHDPDTDELHIAFA